MPISNVFPRCTDPVQLSPHHFLPPNQLPFQSHISSPTFHMSDQSESSHLRVLFQTALNDYEKQTGIELTKHPLAERLQDCNSVESVSDILREQAKDLDKFREKDNVLKPLKKVLTVLHIISSVPSIADITLVCLYHRQGVQVSDHRSIASTPGESNTDWPRNSVLCMYISLVSDRPLCNV